ncbi:MAG: hypothetical protein ACKVH8_18605 [Pirellulales bacterium]|jgi:hypothetical protein
MPAVLKAMMRHADISATMKYYVGQDAESMADAVWKSEFMNTSMNTTEKEAKGGSEPFPVSGW